MTERRPMSPPRRVAVPPALLVGLAAALIAALMGIAWLLGRESGRQVAEAPPADPAPLAPAGAVPPRAVPTVAPPTPAPVLPPPTFAEVPSSPSVVPTPEEMAGGPPASAEAAAVAAYFAELDQLTAERQWEDPQAMAMSIVGELAGGGSSQIEKLRQVEAEAEAKVRRMQVPEPCREHHRRSLELFGAASELLGAIAGSVSTGDLSGIQSAASQGERLQANAEELRRIENELRARYGLPSASP